MAVIYQITNMINGYYYIGSAESFARREWQHKYDLRRGVHKNPKLQAAWNKYGEDAFVFEVIEEVVDNTNVLVIEDTYLLKHVHDSKCYNINPSATASRKGMKLSDTSKAKLSRNRKGKAAGENHYRFGKTLSDEVRAKISETQKGRPNKMKGKKLSEEGRKNIAAAVKRGEDSHFYGKPPENLDQLKRAVLFTPPVGEVIEVDSLSTLRDTFGISLSTSIRAAKSGKPISTGNYAGYMVQYKDDPVVGITVPEEFAALPRTRQQAKESGAKQYFTGVPCERGHLSPRAVKGTCIACRREDDKRRNELKKNNKYS